MPPTARPAPRGARRGSLVLTAGPVLHFYDANPPARWLVATLTRDWHPAFASKQTERLRNLASSRPGRKADLGLRRRGGLHRAEGDRRVGRIAARRKLAAGPLFGRLRVTDLRAAGSWGLPARFLNRVRPREGEETMEPRKQVHQA